MKVEGPNKSQEAGKSKKKSGVSGDESGFGALISDGAGESSGAQQTRSIAHVDALLALQSVEDPTERTARGRMQKRANTILDELDRLRNALLSGRLTVGHVLDIADVVASHREKISDPALTALLDEIDLRAQVEIAKLTVAMDKTNTQK